MPRTPASLPVLKCDFCPLTTRNHFIYKRHRKRCMRENASPSQKEALQDSQGGLSEEEEVLKENGTKQSVEDSSMLEQEGSSQSQQSEQTEPRDSEACAPKQEQQPETRITLRLRKRSMSDADSSGLEQAGKACFEITTRRGGGVGGGGGDSETQELEVEEEKMEEEEEEMEGSFTSTSTTSTSLPPPNVCRNYRCKQCAFFTHRSAEFLRHKKYQHKAKLDIFNCSECEYASEYKHKLLRHMKKLHNLNLKTGDVFAENGEQGSGSSSSRSMSQSQPQSRRVQALRRSNKVVSSKVAPPRSAQNLDSLLVKLRSRQSKEKVTEATLSNFLINAGSGGGGGSSHEEGGGGRGVDLYKCRLCLFTAPSKAKTLRHLQACHINAALFRCNMCSFKTYSKIDFYAHKKKHRSGNTVVFNCTECAYATDLRPNFERHMQQHGCDKPNKCSLCSYATDHEGALKRHVTSHHPNTEQNQSLVIAGDEAMLADRGGEDWEEEEDIEGMMEEDGGLEGDGFRCPLCTSQYKRCADLNRHMKLKHNVSRKEFVEQNAGDDDEEIFDIDDDDDGEEDVEDGYDNEELDEASEGEDSDDGQPLSALKKGIGVQMMGKKCSYCSYIPKGPNDLKRHMKVHSVVKRFKCSLCWKKYKYLGDLSVHMRRDHEVEPDDQPKLMPQKVSIVATRKNSPKLFRCPACPFHTKVKVEMDRHSQEHTEEKTYSCKLCAYQTYWRGDMGRHLYRRHAAEVTCEADVKEFFIFRPERRALTKGGRGPEGDALLLESSLDDGDGASSKAGDDLEEAEDQAREKEMIEAAGDGGRNGSSGDGGSREEDPLSLPVTEVPSATISSCLEVTDGRGNKTFRCQLCSFSHHHSYKLKTHMDTHLNLKQFKCPVCGRRGNWKYDMRKHMSSKHPNCRDEVITLSVDEAKATIGDYLAAMSNILGPKKDGVCSVSHINIRARPVSSPHKASSSTTTPNTSPLKQSTSPDERFSSPQKLSSEGRPFDGEDGNDGPVDLTTTSRNKPDMKKEESSGGGDAPAAAAAETRRETRGWDFLRQQKQQKPSASSLLADASAKKKRTYEYKCSHCQYRSWYRNSVSKHQQDSHGGQLGLGILAKPIYITSGQLGPPMEDEVEEGSQQAPLDQPPKSAQQEAEREKEEGRGEPMEEEEEEEELDDADSSSSFPLYRCAECGKEGTSKGSIKKHYNYIHPDKEVRIVSVADGVEFNYYSGLLSSSSDQPPSTTTTTPRAADTTPEHPTPPPPSSREGGSGSGNGVGGGVGGGCGSLASILNDPKKHGYSRPFKCSVCGQRSNWKWDIKKHLRVKHPGQCGHVVVLQLDQALASLSNNRSASSLEDNDNDDSEESGSVSSLSVSSVSSAVTPFTPEKRRSLGPPPPTPPSCSPSNTYKYQEMMLGRYKRYKCSGCGYRSNWRTDIIRHIERRHRDGGAEVIFMGVDEARETFESYSYQPANVPQSPSGEFKSPKPPSPLKTVKKQQPLVTGKVWHCPKCKYMTAVRTHVVTHMQSHGMKPFRCMECGLMSRFRSPMNRHIRKLHNSTDYKMYCKIIIKYLSPGQQQIVFPERPVVAAPRFVEAYLCRVCTANPAETSTKEDMVMHLLSQHSTADATQALKIRRKLNAENGGGGGWDSLSQHSDDNYSSSSSTTSNGPRIGGRVRRYFCTICPYGTAKRSMLTFHHTYHSPSPQNRYKCKLCPYWVCAPRLLHQHMKVHEDGYDSVPTSTPTLATDPSTWKLSSSAGGGVEYKTPPSSPTKSRRVSVVDGSPKRHVCEKCPYTTNSKNDFLYHKQFHRPKPTASYKCEHCDYWVTHKRLLRQHSRLHGEEYQEDSAASPTKSLGSDPSSVTDAVEIAAIKQRMISSKITASLSSYPSVSPMKLATQLSASNRPGYVYKEGVYKKLHKCSKCPYTNVRSRNVRLHELMHGRRSAPHPLMKCPHCDYYVGAKGLLSHHMKVHNQQYRPDPTDCTTFDLERREQAPGAASIMSADADDDSNVFVSPEIPQRHKKTPLPGVQVDTLLEISRYKKFSCEKCPYASGRRSHFTRHMELHGSRQRHVCLYCDYSVPSMILLQQHQRIHLMPNHNLLATQSFSNLNHLKEVPADVALASAIPPTESSQSVTISVVHDHLDLYENDDSNTVALDATPKKLYRCDRCPYANVRRDHLLTHLRFHLSRSQFQCPYCDYSAPKQQLRTQHIRVHFCPLPELTEWLIENGQSERAQEMNDIDLTHPLEVANRFHNSGYKRKLPPSALAAQNRQAKAAAKEEEDSSSGPPAKKQKTEDKENGNAEKDKDVKSTSASNSETSKSQPSTSTTAADADDAGETKKKKTDKESANNNNTEEDKANEKEDKDKAADNDKDNIYICQYCDREFPASKLLVAHELQHLIGNHFEVFDDGCNESSTVGSREGATSTTTKAEENRQHVALPPPPPPPAGNGLEGEIIVIGDDDDDDVGGGRDDKTGHSTTTNTTTTTTRDMKEPARKKRRLESNDSERSSDSPDVPVVFFE